MSDETKHPERRAGQLWRFECHATARFPAITRTFALTAPSVSCGNEGWNTDDKPGFVADNAWREVGSFTMTLVAEAPATPQPCAPVVACKAPTWCGFGADSKTDKRRAVWYALLPRPLVYWSDASAGQPMFCSPSCRDAKHPPLAAQPAEAKAWCVSCGCGAGPCDYEHLPTCPSAKPAEQPKPAAKGHELACRGGCGTVQLLTPNTVSWRCASCGEKECQDCREIKGGVAVRIFGKRAQRFVLCDPCFMGREECGPNGYAEGAGILRDPAIPERIAKPRMAHSMGVEDPTLSEAR